MISFDPQPRLVGELVELRPLREDDFDELYAVASDPLIWEQHPDRERWREDAFRLFFAEHLASGGALAVIDRRSDRMIGSTRFHGYGARRSEVEIGWTFLARSHWGGAYNGELKTLMLEHAFRSVDRVVFLVDAGNLRSRRAVEKVGAVLAGTRRDAAGRESLLYEVRRNTAYNS
jgi:N-acetyltransferase